MQKPTRGAGIIGLMALGLLVMAAITAGPAQAVSSNGPYYAEPAWDQKLPASTRFVLLLDWEAKAVLDRETGLVWEQSPSGATNFWQNSLRTCLSKNVGGSKGWRLPTITELASLIDPSATTEPTLPSGHPFVNVSRDTVYWSSTRDSDPLNPNTALMVRFRIFTPPLGGSSIVGEVGILGSIPPSSTPSQGAEWCVRSGGLLY
jgi:hypothetical protein